MCFTCCFVILFWVLHGMLQVLALVKTCLLLVMRVWYIAHDRLDGSQPFVISFILELSIKSGKHGTRTLSLVQNRVRFQKILEKSTLAFNGPPNSEMHQFLCQTEFHPVLTRLSFFLSASTAATYIFTAPTCTTTIITWNLVH